MVLATCPAVDQSASIIRQNMAKIKLLTVAGSLLCHPEQTHRIVRLRIQRGDRCDLSLFQLGLRLLDHLLNEDHAIPVAFHVSIET
jgi:hypothetical protein